MSKNKATHVGTCQCCGSAQKLPGGVLSLHGYTLDYGFFNGTCQGAGHLPFEQSFDLVEKFIQLAQDQIERLKKQQAELRSASGTKAWYHHYRTSFQRGVRSGYYWVEGEVTVETKTYGDGDRKYTTEALFITVGDKKISIDAYSVGYAKTVEATVKALNEKRAVSLDKTIASAEQYIAWQKKRIAEWKPGILTPVK